MIEVPRYVPRPADCDTLQPVKAEPGDTTRDLIRKMDEALSNYEAQVKACAKRTTT